MRILSLALLVTLVGCGVENSSQTSAESTAPTTADLEKVVGTYAMTASLKNTANYPAPVGKITSVASQYRLAEVALVDGKLKIKERACALSVSSDNKSFKLSTDKNVVQTASTTESELEVSIENGSLQITRPLSTEVLGAKLDNIATDKIPTSSNDPRLVQMDGESSKGAKTNLSFTTPKILLIPGITIASDLFFVMRSTNTYSASMDSKGDMKGPLSDKTEQSVISVSNPLAAAAKGVTLSETTPDRGAVSFTRIEDGSDCEDVVRKLAPDQAN